MTDAEHVQRAKDFQDKGDMRAGVIELKNALGKNPNNPEARWLLGNIYIKLGNGPAAEKELRRAQTLGVSKEAVLAPLGKALLFQRKYDAILEEIKPNKSYPTPERATIYALRGEAYLGKGEAEEAADAFDSSLEADPNMVQALLGKAQIAIVKRQLQEAHDWVDKALAESPESSDAWLMKGHLLRMQAKDKEAMHAYEQVLEINPRHLEALLRLAAIHLKKNEMKTAQAQIDAALKINPKNIQAKYLQAVIDFRQGNFNEVVDRLQEVLKIRENYMSAVLLYGVAQLALGSHEQAEKSLSRYLARFPGNLYARKMLATALLKIGQVNRAIDTLKPALSRDTGDAQLLALAGEAHMQARDYAKADEYFEKAVAVAPGSAELRTKLGLSRLAAGEVDQAIADLQSAVGLDSDKHQANILLAMTYLNTKKYDKALDTLTPLEKKLPDNPLISNLKGGAYLGKKDFEAARKSFEKALDMQPGFFAAAQNLAQLDLLEKKPEAARNRFENLLKVDENNSRAMLALARLAEAGGQEKEYIAWIEKAAAANPAALEPKIRLANYYLKKGKPGKALTMAKEAQTANPDNPVVLETLGRAQSANGDNYNALASYEELVRITPNSPLAHYRLARMQAVTGSVDKARDSLEKALQLRPDYLDAETALIALTLSGGHYAEALKIARNMQAQHPKLATGWVLEGDVYFVQEQYEKAAQAYKKAFETGESGAIAIQVHKALSLAGDRAQAEAGLQEWLKAHPGDPAVLVYQAQRLTAEGRGTEAIKQFEAVLEKDAENTVALNNLAWLYQQENDPRALATAEQAYRLRPDDATIVDTLGWILVTQAEPEKGIDMLKKAVSMAPDAPTIRYHLAAALAKAGRKAEARNELKPLIESGKKFQELEAAKALLDQL